MTLQLCFPCYLLLFSRIGSLAYGQNSRLATLVSRPYLNRAYPPPLYPRSH